MAVINEKIKEARARSGLTFEEVAARVGVSKQTIHKYETGIISNIPSDKIELLAKALGTSPSFLMGWESSPSFQAGTLHAKIVKKLRQLEENELVDVDEFLDFVISRRHKQSR